MSLEEFSKLLKRFIIMLVFVESVAMIVTGRGAGVFCFLFVATSFTATYAEITDLDGISLLALMVSLLLMYECSKYLWTSPLALIIAGFLGTVTLFLG